MFRHAAALACLSLVAAPALADTVTINFESDASGFVANGFQSADSNLVSFSDSMDADLQILDFGHHSNGKGLAVFGDDPSYLIMEFSTTVSSLSLSFGNDDPNFASAGDLARLQVFDGMTFVGEVFVEMNRDDIMNQTIAAAGFGAFNRATFAYVNPLGELINLIECVDDITFETTGVAVPLPTAGTLGLAGLVGIMSRRRRA